ncbi:MAG: hypothetical protein ACLUDU_00210 [Butyricimonas faecihominis]
MNQALIAQQEKLLREIELEMTIYSRMITREGIFRFTIGDLQLMISFW